MALRTTAWARARASRVRLIVGAVTVLILIAATGVLQVVWAQEVALGHDLKRRRNWSTPLDGVKRDRVWIRSQMERSRQYLNEARQILTTSAGPEAVESAFAPAYQSYRLLRYADHGLEAILVRSGEATEVKVRGRQAKKSSHPTRSEQQNPADPFWRTRQILRAARDHSRRAEEALNRLAATFAQLEAPPPMRAGKAEPASANRKRSEGVPRLEERIASVVTEIDQAVGFLRQALATLP